MMHFWAMGALFSWFGNLQFKHDVLPTGCDTTLFTVLVGRTTYLDCCISHSQQKGESPCSVMESIFDILECSVCLERLDATSKILPCQHTFCVRCLSTILKTSHDLRCPECREPVPVRDVSELPTNILLIRILDGLVKPTSGSNHLEDSPSKQSSTVTSGIAGKNAANVSSFFFSTCPWNPQTVGPNFGQRKMFGGL